MPSPEEIREISEELKQKTHNSNLLKEMETKLKEFTRECSNCKYFEQWNDIDFGYCNFMSENKNSDKVFIHGDGEIIVEVCCDFGCNQWEK